MQNAQWNEKGENAFAEKLYESRKKERKIKPADKST